MACCYGYYGTTATTMTWQSDYEDYGSVSINTSAHSGLNATAANVTHGSETIDPEEPCQEEDLTDEPLPWPVPVDWLRPDTTVLPLCVAWQVGRKARPPPGATTLSPRVDLRQRRG